jgi:anti-sigma factor RsiW
MGCRLVATEHGPAGMLMYDNDHGIRLVMLVRLAEIDKDTAKMAKYSDGSVTNFSWSHKGIGYSLVGETTADILHPLADDARTQINTNA